MLDWSNLLLIFLKLNTMDLNNSQYRNKSLITVIVSHFARFVTICYYFAHLHRSLFVSERISCQIWLLILVSASNVSIVHVSTPNGSNFSLLLTELLRNLTFYYVSQLLFFHRISFLFSLLLWSLRLLLFQTAFFFGWGLGTNSIVGNWAHGFVLFIKISAVI
jgi:hypothetical protein